MIVDEIFATHHVVDVSIVGQAWTSTSQTSEFDMGEHGCAPAPTMITRPMKGVGWRMTSQCLKTGNIPRMQEVIIFFPENFGSLVQGR